MLFKLTDICAVPLLATVILSTVDITESKQEQQLPNALLNVLRKYGKQSNDFDIEAKLRAKVVKLIPFLDDYKHKITEKKSLALRKIQKSDNILNHNPVNKKYIRLRNEVEKLLKIEPVSEDTKSAVTNALDQITTDLMSNECLWKKKAEEDKEPMTVDQTKLVMNHILQKWNDIFDQNSIKSMGSNVTGRKAFALLTGLRKFVFNVHEEYKRLESRYAMKCDIVDKFNKQEAVISLETNELGECDTICSAELLKFMMKFYKQLRMTYTDVFNNYIQMYHKEITLNDLEGSLENQLNKMTDHVEKKIKINFEEAVEFSTNQTISTLDAVSNFIDKVLDTSKKIIEKSLHGKLRNLSPKLRMTVREDLQTTASIELGNLRQDLKNSLCAAFQTCNSITSRKYIERDEEPADPNSIHLKFKLKFDKNPLKEALEESNSRKMKRVFSGKNIHESESNKTNLTESLIGYKESSTTNIYSNYINVTKTTVGNSKEVHMDEIASKYQDLNVTRTTLKQYFERGTAKLT